MTGGGDSKDSATEINRLFLQVRMERWGKSPPPVWQQTGLCKPHPKQDLTERHEGAARPVSGKGRMMILVTVYQDR